MRRDTKRLAQGTYDVVIIGGGISGACTAWDAALRGLSVALIDKGDFGQATSAASSKVIHGGIRYLQYADFRQLRRSMAERATFSKIAPHLLHPVPFLIPTYGHLLRGKEILTSFMALYHLLTVDRNRGVKDPSRHIPGFRVLSRDAMMKREPGLPRRGLTGGVVYHDWHMESSERMTLSFILSAATAGAEVANYLAAIGFLKDGDRIHGIKVKDTLNGEEFEVRGRIVVNAAGPWVDRVLESISARREPHRFGLGKGIHIVTRPITKGNALVLTTQSRSVDALVSRGGRHFFVIPWRGHSLIGTTYSYFSDHPDTLRVDEQDISDFIDEINEVYPAGNLSREDVVYHYGGLYLVDGYGLKNNGYQSIQRSQVRDHEDAEGISGLISAIGAKYTTGRRLAQDIVDLIFEKLGRDSPEHRTGITPIYGGKIDDFERFLARETRKRPFGLDEEIVRHLIRNYGSAYLDVLEYLDQDSSWGERTASSRPVIRAEIVHAVRHEMALRLSDVIFRRTGLGTLGNPGDACLSQCAGIMANELGWDASTTQQELEHALSRFAREF